MTETATLGGGCFWCLEAVFERLKGVVLCESGYSGGSDPAPTYEKICGGQTGHAEVVRLHYDPQVLSFRQILEVFFATHDPTTLNRQGNDQGTQYRSVIFFHDENQKEIAKAVMQDLEKQGAYKAPLVTELSPLVNYFPAEEHHQHYFANNPTQGYCAYVVAPKVEKTQKLFGDLLQC